MNKLLVVALAPLMLSGCLAAAATGAVVGTTGAVVGGAVDLVTESQQEKDKKELKKLRKEKKERERAEREARKND